MKKYLIFMSFVLMFFSISITAQEQVNKPVNIIEKRVEKIATELSLTDVEKAKVKALLEKQGKDYSKLKSELLPGSGDSKLKLKELRKTQNDELKKVLGNEKYAKYKENRTQEKQKIEAAKAKI